MFFDDTLSLILNFSKECRGREKEKGRKGEGEGGEGKDREGEGHRNRVKDGQRKGKTGRERARGR